MIASLSLHPSFWITSNLEQKLIQTTELFLCSQKLVEFMAYPSFACKTELDRVYIQLEESFKISGQFIWASVLLFLTGFWRGIRWVINDHLDVHHSFSTIIRKVCMAATTSERNQKMLSTVALFVPSNLFIFYILWIKFMSYLVHMFYSIKLWSRENVFTISITLAHFLFCSGTVCMSVFPLGTWIYNHSSTMLFAFSFRGWCYQFWWPCSVTIQIQEQENENTERCHLSEI